MIDSTDQSPARLFTGSFAVGDKILNPDKNKFEANISYKLSLFTVKNHAIRVLSILIINRCCVKARGCGRSRTIADGRDHQYEIKIGQVNERKHKYEVSLARGASPGFN